MDFSHIAVASANAASIAYWVDCLTSIRRLSTCDMALESKLSKLVTLTSVPKVVIPVAMAGQSPEMLPRLESCLRNLGSRFLKTHRMH